MNPLLPSLEHHPCSISLPVFEGPLDLLLHLVVQARLDITTVSLVQVTSQYLAYMRAGERIDHRALADFVAIGARLIWLKSRALLPAPPPLPEPDEEEPEDLVEMLREYRRFKEAAGLLKEREEDGVRAFPRLAPPPDVPDLPGLSQVTLEKLAAIVQRALQRGVVASELAPLERLRFSVRDKIAEIELVLRVRGRLSFNALVSGCRGREEIITTFFAVLELIKQCGLVAAQDTAFGEIVLLPAVPDADGSAPDASEPQLARIQ